MAASTFRIWGPDDFAAYIDRTAREFIEGYRTGRWADDWRAQYMGDLVRFARKRDKPEEPVG